MAIETVFLDAGGVVVFPNWVRISEALARQGVAVAADDLAAAEPFVKRQIDEGRLVATTDDHRRGWLYFDLLFERVGVPRGEATDRAVAELYAYHQRSSLWEWVPADVEPALSALTGMGLRLVAVSNANGRVQELFDRLGLLRHFHCVIDSFIEGVEKPDPRLFRIALERSGARAETTVHVGDLYHVDVIGARAAGLSAVLLDAEDLYPGVDCDRVRSLDELVTLLRDRCKGGRSA